MKKGYVGKSGTLMIRATWCCAHSAANSKLANVGFAAVQKPTFYRKRAQVAEDFAKHCRDEIASKCSRGSLDVGENLPRSPAHESRAGHHQGPSEKVANIVWKSVLGQKRTLTRLLNHFVSVGSGVGGILDTLSKCDCHPDHNCDCQHAGQR